VTFNPVTTRALRLKIELPKDFSAGIYEWEVELQLQRSRQPQRAATSL